MVLQCWVGLGGCEWHDLACGIVTMRSEEIQSAGGVISFPVSIEGGERDKDADGVSHIADNSRASVSHADSNHVVVCVNADRYLCCS